MTDADGDPLVERLGRLETGQVSDVLDEAGLPNHAFSSALAPIGPDARMAGRAVCARGEPLVKLEQGLRRGLGNEAMEGAVRPGSVVVIDAGGFIGGACLGGFVAFTLQRNGARGLIVDGAVRDAAEIRELALPTFSRAVTPVNGGRRWSLVEVDQPIAMPGQSGKAVPVHPGDYILGDADGIVVIPADIVLQIIEDSEELQRIERLIGEELRGGGERAAVFKRNPRFDHVRQIAR